jgi:hypothetical protein
MFADGNPAELDRLLDQESVAEHRSLFCPGYEACLDHAAERGWQSFSCGACGLHAERREMEARWALEHHYHPTHAAEGALVAA